MATEYKAGKQKVAEMGAVAGTLTGEMVYALRGVKSNSYAFPSSDTSRRNLLDPTVLSFSASAAGLIKALYSTITRNRVI